MESLHKAMLIGTLIGILIVSLLISGGYYISCWRQVEMAKAGYEQVQTIGYSNYIWQKVRP